MGFNCLKATEPLGGASLLFTTQSKGVPGAQLIDLGKSELTFGFEPGPREWESSTLTTRIIAKTYITCKCPVFRTIKHTLHYKVAKDNGKETHVF